MFAVIAKNIFRHLSVTPPLKRGGLSTLVDAAQFLSGKGSASIEWCIGSQVIGHEDFNQINFCSFCVDVFSITSF